MRAAEVSDTGRGHDLLRYAGASSVKRGPALERGRRLRLPFVKSVQAMVEQPHGRSGRLAEATTFKKRPRRCSQGKGRPIRGEGYTTRMGTYYRNSTSWQALG